MTSPIRSIVRISRFARYAWGVLLYNLLVILWGAYVRATGSGAGCGSHWPLCNGEVIPRTPQAETLIEFTHRLTSGLAFLLVVLLLILSFRSHHTGSQVRWGAIFSMVFIVTEALIGAGLVLFEWVAHDASLGRAIAMSVHLLNTFFLLAALSLTAWWASGGGKVDLASVGWGGAWLGIGFIGMLVLGVSGALTALGDTLFPASTLQQGIAQDFSPTAHFLIRLRLLHPMLAVSVGIYLVLLAAIVRKQRPDERVRILSQVLTVVFLMQLGVGVVNVYLLAPVWLQLVHLLIADLTWILLVMLTAAAFSTQERPSHFTHRASSVIR